METELSLENLIATFFLVAQAADHEFESVPVWLLDRVAITREWGLLALHVPVANWGALLDDGGHNNMLMACPDPLGNHWRGRPNRSGKHYMDGGTKHPYGGLGICHLDGANLADVYDAWGYPKLPASWIANPSTYHFNHILDSIYREEWLHWADGLLAQPSFHQWLVRWWLTEVWVESLQLTKRHGFGLHEAMMNARIRNSSSSVARRLASMSADDQARAYIAEKNRTSGRDAAERAERQVANARRAIALFDWYAGRVVPLP